MSTSSAASRGWAGPDSELAELVRTQSTACLAVYKRDEKRLTEDFNSEDSIVTGGYSRKQLVELVQNGADQLTDDEGRIEIVVTPTTLYAANSGKPFSEDGVIAVMTAHSSQKDEDQIGRYGLGFKSVVAVSDSPRILSRSVSFGFDREKSLERINAAVPGKIHAPVLRLADPLDPFEASKDDSILRELMEWASTVVVLPFKDPLDHSQTISDGIKEFDPVFLLFCPKVRELRLVDSINNLERVFTQNIDSNGKVELADSSKTTSTKYQVMSRRCTLSEKAWADLGETGRRITRSNSGKSSVLLQWAVPDKGRTSVGTFYAFFPTDGRTTLSGAINAPWKLANDRVTLIDCEFNRELLTEHLPALIAESLPNLADPEDPAGVLDLLPARGQEDRGWADDVINDPIYETLKRSGSLPDCDGSFRAPSQLSLHPRKLNPETKEFWLRETVHRDKWVHPGVDSPEPRRTKAERLMGATPAESVLAWLESLTDGADAMRSASGLAVSAHLATHQPEFSAQVRESRVLLLEDGTLAKPQTGRVFLRSHPDESGYAFISADLARVPQVTENLLLLGIQVLDSGGQLRNALTRQGEIDWADVWSKSRAVPAELAETIFFESFGDDCLDRIHARNAERKWMPISSLLLAGEVIPADLSRDRSVLIDPAFHGADGDLLRRLGATDRPVTRGAPDEPWVRNYQEAIKQAYINDAQGARPAEDKLIVNGHPLPSPLQMLSSLSPEGAVIMTRLALQLDSGEKWTVRHSTNRSYGVKQFDGPVDWWLRRHGAVDTGVGPWAVKEALEPLDWEEADFSVLPIADVTERVCQRLRLGPELDRLGERAWAQLLELARTWEDGARRVRLYCWAANEGVPAPATVTVDARSVRRAIAPTSVAVSLDPDEYEALLNQGLNVVLVDKEIDKQILIDNWGMADGSAMLQQHYELETSGAPEALLDRLPWLKRDFVDYLVGLELQLCAGIQRITATPGGQTSEDISEYLDGSSVYVTASDDHELIRQVSRLLDLELSDEDIEDLFQAQLADEANERKAQIREATSPASRLLATVGEEELRKIIPRPAIDAVAETRSRDLDGLELAEMALAVHGFSVLQQLRGVLEKLGLNPPQQWAGSSAARRFVLDLGFDADFAGYPTNKRPESVDVEGPAYLPELHDYQVIVGDAIKSLIRGDGPSRGMVSLPTGAGKTRVAVQALVDEVAAGNLKGPVIWIAQTQELCEQAVQTWAYVWRARGPADRLSISRYWGSNNLSEHSDAFQLVVATDDKLHGSIERTDCAWLTEAELVVFDEAHTSVAPTAKRILTWLGRGPKDKSRRMLIGLTATAYRGFNIEESEELKNLYHDHRLDTGAFPKGKKPYPYLQDEGVLARVRQEVLDGSEIEPTAEELVEFKRFKAMPKGLLQRIGTDSVRNRRIVESVVELTRQHNDWPILLFASSVENANVLAAQLALRGVKAVSISAETEQGARRKYIEDFINGDIQVITNYNVLAQGFDAPMVRAVYVTRPTYSPNVYQQMIGRGLRGPRNGGSDEVFIVNVKDNISQFGDALTFDHFEKLWNPPEDESE